MKTERKKGIKKLLLELPIMLIAGFIFACGLKIFTAPSNIAPGGVSGIAVIISSLTGIGEGILYFLINIPIVIVGFIFLGKGLMLRTLFSVIVVTVAADFVFPLIPAYQGEPILAAIFGGVLMGAGLGLNYRAESTSGGTDIINKIINKKLPFISLGAVSLITDLIVVGIAMAVYNKIESGLYAIITVYISSKMVDVIVYGSYEGKMMLIFSDKHKEISEEIMKTGRGVTFLHGTGAYKGNENNVICCAVHKYEYVKFKKITKEIDPSAFMIITSAKEVLGQGFKEIN